VYFAKWKVGVRCRTPLAQKSSTYTFGPMGKGFRIWGARSAELGVRSEGNRGSQRVEIRLVCVADATGMLEGDSEKDRQLF